MTKRLKDKRCLTCHEVKPLIDYEENKRKCKLCVQKAYDEAPIKNKLCSKCKITQVITEFNKSSKTKDGFYPMCNSCSKKAKQQSRIKNPVTKEQRIAYVNSYKKQHESRRKNYEKRRNLVQFGITEQEYNLRFKEQNGVCAICKNVSANKLLAVDHCHITMEVRGLLCSNCNTALGLFKDSIENLLIAIDYLGGKK